MKSNLSKIHRGLIGICIGLGFALPVRAGTWTLANGDRLTGELVKEEPEFIEVQHPQLGRLKVARKNLLVPAPAKPAAASGNGANRPAAGAAKQDLKPEPPPAWKRQVEFGYAQQSGAKDKQDLVIRGQLDGREGASTFRVIGRLLRSEANGKTVTDRNEGDFRWRFDVNKRLFAQALTTYEEDDVRKIDLNLEQQFGGGYRVLDSERHKANVGLGAGAQHLQRPVIGGQTALLGSIFQDYAYQLNTRLKLVQEASVMLSDRGTLNLKNGTASTSTDGSYRLKFNTGVQSKVTDHLSLNVRFEFDFDRSVLERELRSDQRLTTALGYLW